jgi:hypothetical protein
MFLAVRDGLVAERNSDIEPLLKLDPLLYEVFEWHGPTPYWEPHHGAKQPLDPRTFAQKLKDGRERYRRRRRRAYSTLRAQLDMMYWDAMNGTTTWIDEITRIKELFPKPPGA